MKFGIHLSTYTKSWSDDIFQFLEKSKEYGYDGVEFPLMDPINFDVKKANALLEKYNMECTCGTSLNTTKDISSLNKIARYEGINHLKKCIDICNELETDCLGGVLYTPWGYHISRKDAKENIKFMLENLNVVGNYAKNKNVVLALEVLNRYETYVLNTIEEGKDYLKKINNENIKLHFDTFHANIEEKSLNSAIKLGGNDIYHIHFCENDRGIPGTGNIDWEGVKDGLLSINYDRWITIENFVMPNCEVGRETFVWRNINSSKDDVAKAGIKFMKNLFYSK
ncbi:sugar phosphate isomerase/epimerase [Clostridioides difficile]|nr:sugar phosphate isomerase/epimerase [Clostridioides difficile]